MKGSCLKKNGVCSLGEWYRVARIAGKEILSSALLLERIPFVGGRR